MNDPIRNVQIQVGDQTVSGIVQAPANAQACYVFAHGAGAGMAHSFMAAVAAGLAERHVATLRYQFPYMEQGKKRTDTPAVAHAAVRAAVQFAADLPGAQRLFAGGKSFGARMTSQAQALEPLPGVRGLVFVGFPLHNADQPAITRADHLANVKVPMLFIQGTQDKLAYWTHLVPVVDKLGPVATLMKIEHADHSFHVLKRTGRTDPEVMQEVLDGMARWMLG